MPIANECKCTYWITNEDAQNWSMAVLHVQHLMTEEPENSITLKSTPQMRFSQHLRNVWKPAWKMVQWENIFPRRQVVKVWFCWFRIIRAMHNKVSLARLPAAWIWNHFKIWQNMFNLIFIYWQILNSCITETRYIPPQLKCMYKSCSKLDHQLDISPISNSKKKTIFSMEVERLNVSRKGNQIIFSRALLVRSLSQGKS